MKTDALAPIAAKILVGRGSAHKIVADSGKQLLITVRINRSEWLSLEKFW